MTYFPSYPKSRVSKKRKNKEKHICQFNTPKWIFGQTQYIIYCKICNKRKLLKVKVD